MCIQSSVPLEVPPEVQEMAQIAQSERLNESLQAALSSLRAAIFQSAASWGDTRLLMAVAGLALTLATLFTHS